MEGNMIYVIGTTTGTTLSISKEDADVLLHELYLVGMDVTWAERTCPILKQLWETLREREKNASSIK